MYTVLVNQNIEQDSEICELAANTLSIIISANDNKPTERETKNEVYFLNWLLDEEKKNCISDKCRTACIVQLAKRDRLAIDFVEKRGFYKLKQWLIDCVQPGKNDQLAYNTLTIMWILSFHDDSL